MKKLRYFAFIGVIILVGSSLVTSYAQTSVSPYVVPIIWSFDGRYIALVNADAIEVKSTEDLSTLQSLALHGSKVTKIAWSPDGSRIASSSYDQTVKLWHLSSGDLAELLHSDGVAFVKWHPVENILISSVIEEHPTLFVWNASNFTLLERRSGGSITSGAFSPDNLYFATSTPWSIRILSASDFTLLKRVESSSEPICCANQIYSLAWSQDGLSIVTGSIDGLVTLWDAKTLQILWQSFANGYARKTLSEIEDLSRSWVRDVAFSPDGSAVLAISGDGTFREWAVQDGALLRESQLPPLATGTFSPYTGRLAYLDLHLLTAVQGATTAQTLSDGLHIIVPAPSFEKLNTLARRCVQDGNATQSAVAQLVEAAVTESSLEAFIAQVKTLPVDAIPPACVADLLAIAEALQGK
jgi:WD40 repeat protein